MFKDTKFRLDQNSRRRGGTRTKSTLPGVNNFMTSIGKLDNDPPEFGDIDKKQSASLMP